MITKLSVMAVALAMGASAFVAGWFGAWLIAKL